MKHMVRLALLLLALGAPGAYAALGDLAQAAVSTTGTPPKVLTLGAEPTTGNLLVILQCRNDDSATATFTTPTNFTAGPEYMTGTAGNVAGKIYWKKATSGDAEISMTVTDSDTSVSGSYIYVEIDATGLDLTALASSGSGENEANIASATTSLGSGSASNGTTSGLAVAGFCTDNVDQTDPLTYSNSFTQLDAETAGTTAEARLTKKVLTAAGSNSTTATISSDEGYGVILAWDVPASASITSVSSDDVALAGEAAAVVGTGLDNVDGCEFTDGTNTVAGTYVAGGTPATGGTCTLGSVASTVTANVKFGSGTYRFEDGGVLVASKAGTLNPAATHAWLDITSVASASTTENLFNGLTGLGTDDFILYAVTTTGSLPNETATVDSSGWTIFASGGSKLTKCIAYYAFDDSAHDYGSAGSFCMTFTPSHASAYGLATGQTTADLSVTIPADEIEGPNYAYVSTSATPPSTANHISGSGATAWQRDTGESRTNLLLQSQTINHASWSKTRSSVSADATTAPDGTSTADKLVEDTTASNSHYVLQSYTKAPTAITYTYSVYLRAAERTWAMLQLGQGSDTAHINVNLSTGAAGNNSVTGAFSGKAYTITNAGNGWWRVSLTTTVDAGTTTLVSRVYTANGDYVTNYTGDGTSGIYVWGMQLEAASYASNYVATTTTSVTRAATGDLEYPYVGGLSAGTTYYFHHYRCNSAATPVCSTQITSDAFTTEEALDVDPDQFTLADVSGVEPSSHQCATPRTLSGTTGAAIISVDGGTWKATISGVWQDETAAAGTIEPGAEFSACGTASASYNDATDVALTIGSKNDTFTIVTQDPPVDAGAARGSVRPTADSTVLDTVR